MNFINLPPVNILPHFKSYTSLLFDIAPGPFIHDVFQTLKGLHHATENTTKGFFMLIDGREAGTEVNEMLNLVWDYADKFSDTLVLADKPADKPAEKISEVTSFLEQLMEHKGHVSESPKDDDELVSPAHPSLIDRRSPEAGKPYDYADHHSSQYEDNHPKEYQRVHEYNNEEKHWDSYWVDAKDVDAWVKENTKAKPYNRDDPQYLHFEVPDTRNALPIQPGHENDRKNGKEFPVAESKLPEYHPGKIEKAPGASKKPTVLKIAPGYLKDLPDAVNKDKEGGSRKGSSAGQERKPSRVRGSVSGPSSHSNGGHPTHAGTTPHRPASTQVGTSSQRRPSSSGGASSRNGNGRRSISRSTEQTDQPAYMSGREPAERGESQEVVDKYNTYIDQPLWYRLLAGRWGPVHGNPSKRKDIVEKHQTEVQSVRDGMGENGADLSDSHTTSLPSSKGPISRIHRRSSGFLSTLLGLNKNKSPDWQPVREWNYRTREWDYFMVDSTVTDKWSKEAGYGNYNEDNPRTINVIWDDRTSNKNGKETKAKMCYFGKRC